MKMMQDWLVAHNYGIQTGDCSYAFSNMSWKITDEYEFYITTESLYERGGWIIGGWNLNLSSLIYDDEKGVSEFSIMVDCYVCKSD